MNIKKFVAAALIVGACAGLAGCASVTSAVKKLDTETACLYVKKKIEPAEVTVKSHLGDVKTNPPAFEDAMSGLADALSTSSKATKNPEVMKVASENADALGRLVTDFTSEQSTPTPAIQAKIQTDDADVHTASTAFDKVCHFQP
jgi:hypothetical protein